MSQTECGTGAEGDACAVNMGLIHLKAGDLVSAYRFFLPLAEGGDVQAMTYLVDICERAGDTQRAASWAQRIPS